MREVTLNRVLDIINEFDNLNVGENQLDENLSDLGMDSIMFIQMIVKLEEVFDCEIPDSKLLITEMNTIYKIFDVLHELYEVDLFV